MSATTTDLADLDVEFNPEPEEHPWNSRIADGAAFVLDADLSITPIWGEAEAVAWASGEPMMIAGPTGVGKTTLLQQVVLSMLGIRGDVLGLPTRPVNGRVLYLAMDRPMQIKRSLHRMVSEENRPLLMDGLLGWSGPLPFSVVEEPHTLAAFAEHHGAGAIVIDSLKDLAPGLAKDEIGATVNIAMQEVVARGIEVAALHHTRKSESGQGRRPATIDDVYGSTWITAGMGSVLSVWGTEAGALVADIDHLKQPVDHIGKGARLTIHHNHADGTTTLADRPDVFAILNTASGPLTVSDVAALFHQTDAYTASQREAVRRQLEDLHEAGRAHKTPGTRGGKGGGTPNTYTAVTSRTEPSDEASDRRPTP